MSINLTTLFADILPDPAVEAAAKVKAQTDLLGTGKMSGYFAASSQDQMRKAAGGLFGVDTRTEAETVRQQLQGLGTPSTPAEHQNYANLLDKLRAGSGVQYMMAVAEEKRNEQTVAAQTKQSEAQASQAETARLEVPATISRAASMERQVANDEATLIQSGRTQDDLVAWREITSEHQDRQAAISEETNRIRRLQEENMSTQLGTSDRNAIREATEASREFEAQANHAINVADQYKALTPLAGAAGAIKTKWMAFMGNQDDAQLLKTNFTALRNTLVMANLPPGVASDKDIEIAMSGYPNEEWSGEKIEKFMRGMAKVAALRAEQENARASYMYENQGLDVGFSDVWREIQSEIGYDKYLAERHNLEWVPDDEAVKQRDDVTAAARADLEAAQERLKLINDNGRAARAADAFNSRPAPAAVHMAGGI